MSLPRGSHSNCGSQPLGWEPFFFVRRFYIPSTGSVVAPPPQAGPYDSDSVSSQQISERSRQSFPYPGSFHVQLLSISRSSESTARGYGHVIPPQGDFYRYGCNVNFRYYYACFPTQKS